MIESEAHELSEKQMLDAVVLGQENYKTVIEAIISLAKKAAKEPWDLKEKDEEIKIYHLRSTKTLVKVYRCL